jgi:ABC-type glycerol-3-phosphate transport system substrate-binding protein
MKLVALRSLFIAALAAVAITVACGGDDEAPDDGDAGGAAGGGVTIPVTQALLDSLPKYGGATLVREWLAEEGGVQVREYAVDEPPDQAADAITRHFRDALVSDGWEESDARAAVSGFTKDGRHIVIGRVGPDIQEPPSDATLLNSAEPPAGTAFFFTLEAEEE